MEMIELTEPKCPVGYFLIYPRKEHLIKDLEKKIIHIPTSKEEALNNQKINKEIKKLNDNHFY